jgi:hypothetical protein
MRWDGPEPDDLGMVPILKSYACGMGPQRMSRIIHSIID